MKSGLGRKGVVVVVFLLVCGSVYGQPWPGSGDANDPYQIHSAAQMNAIGADANYWDAHFLLCADIDLSAYTGTSFNIIGMYIGFDDPNNKPFTGVFDGGGHTISNFTYDCNGVDSVGLFAYTEYDPISSAVIRDLGLLNPEVNAANGYYIGSIVGFAAGCEIQRCWSKGGSVSGERYIGGFVGFSGSMVNCYCDNSVSGGVAVGGFAGGYGYLENCYSTGSVTGDGMVGGLAGTEAGCGARAVDSFWDVNSSGCLDSQGGTGLTTAEMQTMVTYVDAGWDFTMLWTIDEGNDYPRLCWEGGGCIKYGGGSGTEEEPYLIYTGQQMYLIGTDSNDWDNHFRLMADIDLSEYTGTSFNIIGSSPEESFTGVFDGGGHTISNFTYGSTYEGNIGLFGVICDPNAEIRDLGLIDPNINAVNGSRVGGLVGYLAGGSLSGCYVEGGSIKGGVNVGGLVGYTRYRECYITSCYSLSSVTGDNKVGGLVGSNIGYIQGCYSAGSVTGDYTVGGLVGQNGRDIHGCYSAGSVSGLSEVGGLVGSNAGGSITSCYSRGDVAGGNYVGGLVGEEAGYFSSIFNSYSTGSVAGDVNVGGLVGYDEYPGDDYIGCFWDSDVNPDVNGIGNATDPNVTGLPTVLMQTASTFTDAGWDFVWELENGPSDDWAEPNGGGYPVLWWQLDEEELPPLPVFSGGIGDINDPYLISTGIELNTIGHNGRLMERHFRLIDDIELDGINFFSIGRGYLFGGVFDGDGHTISNFTYDSNGINDIGLFSHIKAAEAEVRELGLIAPYVDAGSGCYVGALVGYLADGTIRDCYVEGGSVRGRYDVGGMAGYNSGTITNCYSTGSVTGEIRIGGLVGSNWGGYIQGSYSRCGVTGNYAGGLVGDAVDGGIRECYATGDVSGDSYVGGLVGDNGGDYVQGSYSTGKVTGIDYVGGLIGGSYGDIQSCYSQSDVTGNRYVGGLVGKNGRGIHGCYSAGIVDGNDDIGGLVGYSNILYTDYMASFWDSDVNPDVNGIGNRTEPNVVGLPTALMQVESTFTDAGWDFVGEVINGTEDIWKMNCEGMSYPKLSWWEAALGDFVCPDGVNMFDFGVLGDAWMSVPGDGHWDPNCDISEPNDNVIDGLDLEVFVGNWLEGK